MTQIQHAKTMNVGAMDTSNIISLRHKPFHVFFRGKISKLVWQITQHIQFVYFKKTRTSSLRMSTLHFFSRHNSKVSTRRHLMIWQCSNPYNMTYKTTEGKVPSYLQEKSSIHMNIKNGVVYKKVFPTHEVGKQRRNITSEIREGPH